MELLRQLSDVHSEGSHSRLSDDLLDVGETELIDYTVGLRVEESHITLGSLLSEEERTNTCLSFKCVRMRMLPAEPPRSLPPLSQITKVEGIQNSRSPLCLLCTTASLGHWMT